MDIANRKFKYKCKKHPEFKIEFLHVDNLIANKKGQNLFYCSDCLDQDSNFNHQNYQLIKHIIKSGRDQILTKWPPINDKTLLKQLIEILAEKEKTESIISQIEQYFADLKQDILKQLDICKKKMIKQAQELSLNKTEILNKYHAISKVNELTSILIDNKTNTDQKEKKCREVVENVLLRKHEITDQLALLIDQYKKIKKQATFNTKSALQVKKSILDSINNINLFEDQQNVQALNNNDNNNHNQMQLHLSLLAVNLNKNKNILISKNNDSQQQVKIIESKDYQQNIISDIILQTNMKYIFRIEISPMRQQQKCYIGLIQDSNININLGYDDKLCCCLQQKFNNTYFRPYFGNGIDKVNMEGNNLLLSKENQIEFRVCIQDQILEILDYPNYHSKLVLEDKYKPNLINHKNFRLYLGLFNKGNSMTIKNAFIVNKFE